MWEHEWSQMLETDCDLKAFILKMQFHNPLEPHDALCGGRTNAMKLYRKRGACEWDYQLLWFNHPFVNKTKTYPIGHPNIICENFTYIKYYFGPARVKLYALRD